MKLKMIFGLAVIILTINTGKLFAYETEYYSIEMPSTYHYVAEGSYSSTEGYNININVVPYTNLLYYEDIYNENEVNKTKNNIATTIEYMKKNIVESVKSRYPNKYTEEQLQQIKETIYLDTISDVKITSVSKNNYDSIMSLYSYYIAGIESYVLSYSITGSGYVYTFTLSGNSKEYFNKTDLKNAIDSFTIKNYKPLSAKQEGKNDLEFKLDEKSNNVDSTEIQANKEGNLTTYSNVIVTVVCVIIAIIITAIVTYYYTKKNK